MKNDPKLAIKRNQFIRLEGSLFKYGSSYRFLIFFPSKFQLGNEYFLKCKLPFFSFYYSIRNKTKLSYRIPFTISNRFYGMNLHENIVIRSISRVADNLFKSLVLILFYNHDTMTIEDRDDRNRAIKQREKTIRRPQFNESMK